MQLPDEERSQAVRMVAQAMVGTEPERAARLVLEQQDSEATFEFAMVWMQVDPAEASTWADTNIRDATQRAAFFDSAVSVWMSSDEASAIRFVESLDPGPEYDRAALAAIRATESDAAARLIDKMQEPSLKKLAQQSQVTRRSSS